MARKCNGNCQLPTLEKNVKNANISTIGGTVNSFFYIITHIENNLLLEIE